MAPARLAALLELGALVAPRARALPARVEQAFADPRAYLRAHARRMDDRNIERAVPELPWVALIEALIDARACVEIDWKTDAEDVAWAIARLPAVPRAAVTRLKRDPELDQRSTWELLELAGQHLLAHDLTLAALDMGSDAYCLVVLASDDARRAAALARQARYGSLDPFTGKRLAAARKERLAAAARHQRELARERARTARAPQWQCFERGAGRSLEAFSLKLSPRCCDLGYENATTKVHASHLFSSPAPCRAFARRELAARKAEGYRRVASPSALHDTAFIGWLGPLPEDASYFLEGPRIVNAFALRGLTLWRTRATLGRGFAERSEFTHHGTAKAAARALQHELDARQPRYGFRPITRAALMKRYRKPAAASRGLPASLSPLAT